MYTDILEEANIQRIKQIYEYNIYIGTEFENIRTLVFLEFDYPVENTDIHYVLTLLCVAVIEWEYNMLSFTDIDDVSQKCKQYLSSIIDIASNDDYTYVSTQISEVIEMINTTNTKPKKIRRRKLFECEWEIGDTFLYHVPDHNTIKFKDAKFTEDYVDMINNFVLFIKIDEKYNHPHTNPVVVISNKLHDTNHINFSDIILQDFTDDNKNRTVPVTLMFTKMNKDFFSRLTYLGNSKSLTEELKITPNHKKIYVPGTDLFMKSSLSGISYLE